MTDKWETSVGQLRLVGGTRLESPGNLGIAERRSFLPIRRRGKEYLHILVELSGVAFGREELCQDMVDAIAEGYFRTPGTVTYGLRQAVLLANTYLLRANAGVSGDHRVGGVACVVLRGGEAFIAQAGWPVVYLVHRERVRAFPDTLLEDEDISMLGERQTIEVRLFRAPIQPGDTILMVDGPMARQLGITRIGQIVSGDVAQAISNLETLAPPEDCTAMVIQVGPSSASAQTERWTFTPVELPFIPDAELAEQPGLAPSSLPSEAISPPVPEEQPVESFEPTYQEPSSEPTISDRVGALVGAVGDGMRALGERLLPDQRLEPPPSRRRRAERARRGRGEERQTRWGIVLVLVIPLAALLVVGGYTIYRNWLLQSQFQEYLETANLKREIAIRSAESPSVARDYWLEVLAIVNEAGELRPDYPDLQQMRVQAEAEVDRIDGVRRLGQAFKLYEYSEPASAPSRVIVAGLDVYVLDRGTGRVYHHALNELRTAPRNPDAEQVLIQQGQSVEGQTVGSPIDIAWMQGGGERQAGALVILDGNGLLVEYDPAWEQLSSQLVGGQDGWRAPVALSTYDSNLYVLDPMANQIFRYSSQRYTNAPDRWIKQSDADLTKAVDLAIDGSIYVVHSDGRIQKYFGGETVAFTQTRIPRPLAHADALYFDVEEVVKYMYVVDASDERILQLDREGSFILQFQPALDQEGSFRQLAGVFVDETGGKLYYVAAGALYVTNIPAVQH